MLFFGSLEVYEGLQLVGFLRNVISHFGNMRRHLYSASPYFHSELRSVIIKQSSFITHFLFAHRLCNAIEEKKTLKCLVNLFLVVFLRLIVMCLLIDRGIFDFS